MSEVRNRVFSGWAVRLTYAARADRHHLVYAGIGLIDPMLLVPPPVVRTALFPSRREARAFARQERAKGWFKAVPVRVTVTIEPQT
jgi:hypothetical protein